LFGLGFVLPWLRKIEQKSEEEDMVEIKE